MWAAIIVFVLICGYHYTKCHLPSSYQQNKATGWNAYFDVAWRGGVFFSIAFIFTVFIFTLLHLTEFIFNIPLYLWAKYTPFTFASDFFAIRIYGLSMFSVLSITFTVLVSVAKAAEATRNNSDPQKRKEVFKEIARQSAVESIILESFEKGLLLLVTLKSRKVYVGMVDEARFNQLDSSTLVIIPFMSGYRDKDTLKFCVEHNYSDYYSTHGINLTSEPLSVSHFRHVLPFEQIESFSLFNVETFNCFQQDERSPEETLSPENGNTPA